MIVTEIFTGLTGLFVAAAILYLIRRDHLRVRHGVGWILVAALFIVLGFAPTLLDYIASWLEVAYPPTVAVVIGGSALIVKAVLSDVDAARSEVRIVRMVQRLAMLEADIYQLKKQAGKKDSDQEDTDR